MSRKRRLSKQAFADHPLLRCGSSRREGGQRPFHKETGHGAQGLGITGEVIARRGRLSVRGLLDPGPVRHHGLGPHRRHARGTLPDRIRYTALSLPYHPAHDGLAHCGSDGQPLCCSLSRPFFFRVPHNACLRFAQSKKTVSL